MPATSQGTPEGFKKLWQEILKKSGEAQIKVNRGEGTLLRIPLIPGVFGIAAFPRLASFSALALLLARCSLEVKWR